jgi:hypothetical protein
MGPVWWLYLMMCEVCGWGRGDRCGTAAPVVGADAGGRVVRAEDQAAGGGTASEGEPEVGLSVASAVAGRRCSGSGLPWPERIPMPSVPCVSSAPRRPTGYAGETVGAPPCPTPPFLHRIITNLSLSEETHLTQPRDPATVMWVLSSRAIFSAAIAFPDHIWRGADKCSWGALTRSGVDGWFLRLSGWRKRDRGWTGFTLTGGSPWKVPPRQSACGYRAARLQSVSRGQQCPSAC